jgi:hypothetical protein
LGPPLGMYFSRRKLIHPSPPLPAEKVTTALSTNIIWNNGMIEK